MEAKELAVSQFEKGYSCSQAVFSAYAEQLGLDMETALRIAGGVGGGMGRTGQTCGAVTGAIMAIGLKYGAVKAADTETKEKVYALVKEFSDRFRFRNESVTCKELLGVDLSTPDGLKIAREQNLYAAVCAKLVKDAAEIVEEILAK
ncbi:MAG: C_GCAxxG_C_C family protein [Anaerolineae bacterium]|nr:C_GCAxxG_C_C family protein [Anaerolineae bacterium]